MQHICSSLTVNHSIKLLDISDNTIQDESYKILLGMLVRNNVLIDIKYSLENEENIKRLQAFEQHAKLPEQEIIKLLQVEDNTKVLWWEKVLFPIWIWKSFQVSKQEALRFKFDTVALNKLENEMMDKITWILYSNQVIWYLIVFIFPIVFVNECGEGLNLTCHYIYGAYSLLTIYLEIALVLQMQAHLKNDSMLKFNKWHLVELFFG